MYHHWYVLRVYVHQPQTNSVLRYPFKYRQLSKPSDQKNHIVKYASCALKWILSHIMGFLLVCSGRENTVAFLNQRQKTMQTLGCLATAPPKIIPTFKLGSKQHKDPEVNGWDWLWRLLRPTDHWIKRHVEMCIRNSWQASDSESINLLKGIHSLPLTRLLYKATD